MMDKKTGNVVHVVRRKSGCDDAAIHLFDVYTLLNTPFMTVLSTFIEGKGIVPHLGDG